MPLELTRLADSPAPLRLVTFVVVLLLLWVPLAAPIYWLLTDQNLISIVTMTLLYFEFIGLVRWWGQWVYQQSQILRRYGLQFTQQMGRELLQGMAIAYSTLFVMFGLEGVLGWLQWQAPSWQLLRIIPEGCLVALGIGFAEELFFRGWLLDELERDYRPQTSLWANSLIFASLHFIKPLAEILRTWTNFPALVLLGMTLVWAKRSTRSHPYSPDPNVEAEQKSRGYGRLGLPIGLHAGLVGGYYIVNVGQLMQYSGRVPAWITGIDGNPLAGVMGLGFLSFLAIAMKWRLNQNRAIAKL